MSTTLKLADKSQNMEALRNARSYNDIVVVLSRIRTAISSSQSRLAKRLAVINEADLSIDTGEIRIDKAALRSAHSDLTALELASYEIKFARSIVHIVPSDLKLEKLNVLLTRVDAAIVRAKNSAFKYLNELGTRMEPEPLKAKSKTTISLLQRMLPDARITSFIMPDDSDNISLTRYLILRGLKTKNGYALSEFIVALHAQTNFDDTFSYLISFPVRPRETAEMHPIGKNTTLELLQEKLGNSFNVRKIKSISDKSRRSLETLKNVRSVSLVKGSLNLNLESGVTGKDINTLLYQVLPVVHATFGVSDPRLDIIHRVGVDIDGSKVISFLVSDRNFYDRKSLNRLRTLVGMNSETYKDLTQLLDT